MQIELCWDAGNGMRLPISYHHIIQGMIYHNLSFSQENDAYGDFLHDEGYIWGERQFRQFTYGQIKGKYTLENGWITFRDKVRLEIRSPEPLMILTLADNIDCSGIRLQQEQYKPDIFLSDQTVEADSIRVRMLSPICLYRTDPATKHTYYIDPWSPDFKSMANENMIRKYLAFYKVPPVTNVSVTPLRVSEKSKYITKYKGFIVCGWFGEYELRGERKYLDYLYQAGIGAKNSQGFGMFEVLG